MAKAKPEVIENTTEEVVEVSKPDSAAKAAYRVLIETYEKQNPAKFAVKKEALLARLETL